MIFTICNGKAVVSDEGGVKTLTSYKTEVAKIEGDKVTLLDDWDYSMTTIKHVRAFLEMFGFAAGTKAEIEKRYCNE